MNISIEEMPREIARLEDENELLQDRIDKAIEQCKQDIKDIWKWEGAYTEMFDEIIEILKGSE